MAKEIEKAATVDELRQKVRFVKMDTDKYPKQAGNWRVQGLPTLILFDGSTGTEISRIEGAMMSDQLVQWIKMNGNI
jgi:thioredoxin-like negative regulator of GroEL